MQHLQLVGFQPHCPKFNIQVQRNIIHLSLVLELRRWVITAHWAWSKSKPGVFKLSLQLIELRRAALKHTGTILLYKGHRVSLPNFCFYSEHPGLNHDFDFIHSISEVQLEKNPGGTFWWCSASWSPGGCRDPHSTTVFTHPHPPLFIIACVSSSSSSSSTTSKKHPSETTQCYLKPSFCQFANSQSRAGSAQAANSNRAFMFMCPPSQLASFLHQHLN